jgi:hypothetical protein
MMESYYGDEVQQRKPQLEMPHVTVNNRRMTNVQLGNGDVVQGIRRNKDLNMDSESIRFEAPKPMQPLRYTPGLKCDPALEALRPERDMKHQALQGGQWKRQLIQHPTYYDGSFADADMQKFRPDPNPNPMEDPWMMSRMPDQGQMMMPPQQYHAPHQQQQYHQQAPMAMVPMPEFAGYAMPYPQDDISAIKMRNRRFAQSCSQEGNNMGMHQQQMQYPTPAPVWRGPVLQPPAMMPQEMAMYNMSDELRSIEDDLNLTRRATRPFLPQNDPSIYDLQKQINQLETTPYTPVKPMRFNCDEICSTDQLPSPKARMQRKEEPAPEPAKPARREVGIADQIAIRSFVLGKSIGKVGGGGAE